MNYEHLRRSLRHKWLEYYRQNRPWLSKLAVWIDDRTGHRRPTSSFILATISLLEPQITQLFPLMVELSHDPDRVVEALGLDFNPEEALRNADRTAERLNRRVERALPSGQAIAVNGALGGTLGDALGVPVAEPVSAPPVAAPLPISPPPVAASPVPSSPPADRLEPISYPPRRDPLEPEPDCQGRGATSRQAGDSSRRALERTLDRPKPSRRRHR